MSAEYDPTTQWITMGDNSYDGNQIVGTYAGKVSVQDDKGDIISVNANDIGESVQAIGKGVAKLGESFSRIKYVWNNTACDTGHNHAVYINGSNTPFMYVPETTYGTTTPTYKTTTVKDTGALAWSDDFNTIKSFDGPIRHAQYRACTTAENTFGITWYHDNNLEDGQAFIFDQGHAIKPLSQKVIDKANKKSIKLLKEWLSEAEYKYLMEEGNLELPSQHEKDTIYIVNKDPMRRIGIKKHGKVVEKSLCIHASHAYPTGDILLANIMLLKTDEKKFLEIANVHEYQA